MLDGGKDTQVPTINNLCCFAFQLQILGVETLPIVKPLGAHIGLPPEIAFVSIQFKMTDLSYNPGSPTCWGKPTSQRLSFLVC